MVRIKIKINVMDINNETIKVLRLLDEIIVLFVVLG